MYAQLIIICLLQNPWISAIMDRDGKLHCGASVIDSKYLLTAGHCVNPRLNLSGYKIVLGLDDAKKDKGGVEQDFGREDVILHPLYKVSHLTNIFTMVRIQISVLFQNHDCENILSDFKYFSNV